MGNSEDIDKGELTFWDHLVEFLRRFRRMFTAIIIATVAVMLVPVSLNFSRGSYYETITSFIIRMMQADFKPANVELVPISWFAPIEVYFYVSLLLGIVISSPVIAYELYRFVTPALFSHEKKALSYFVVFSTGLFMVGFLVGYFLVTPMSIRTLTYFAELLDLAPVYEFSSFFFLIAGCLLVSGAAFTFPVYVVLLVKANILKTDQIKKNRKYIYPAIIILISVLDPDPTLITESFVGIPIIILTEISLLIARRYEKQEN